MEASNATGLGLPVDLPVWAGIQSNEGLTALGLSKRQIAQVWMREGDVLVEVPKKDGTIRECSGPNASQKMLSMSLLVHLMSVHREGHALWSDIAYGFVPGHGNIDSAHAVRQWMKATTHADMSVAYCDLKGAFGAVSARQVRNVLLDAGLSGWSLELAVRLTTRPDESGRLVLTTGNPVSPLILNAACRDLDRRLAALAGGRGGIAVRYADDIVVTAVGRKSASLKRQLLQAIRDSGFIPHPKKNGATRTSASRKARGYLAVEVVGVIVERTGYRKTATGAGHGYRMVSPGRFRRRIRAIEHRGHDATRRRRQGMKRYAKAVRSWSRPKPDIDWDRSIRTQAVRHTALLARRQRRRDLALS